ncbi:MAG: AmmeMemoRadiSam system radical SAM enzyme [Elusimicrobia bacterium]|nr:AmmeMemoRadiSam system radical SAM enzyme [Elusimicrobiota bacterium]
MAAVLQALSALLAALAVFVSLAAASLISRFPPPRTFAELFPAKDNPSIAEARFWAPACNGVVCFLCPRHCFLPEGGRGLCKVRMNSGGKLKTLVYARPVSVHVDPIEKKPVFHLLPGTWIYSIATAGCNLRCAACQNWEISQAYPEQAPGKTPAPAGLTLSVSPDGRMFGSFEQKEYASMTPKDVVDAALGTRSKSIAYTYSEPVVFYEYMYDTAYLAREKGLRNVMVSAGYINRGPLKKLAPLMDVVKIDLKGFDEGFYRSFAGGELRFVLDTLKSLKEHGVLTEVVNLVVPTLNDKPEDFKRLSVWVRDNLGKDTPVFFSRFSPNYRLQNLPQTPVETLTLARDIAMKEGLRYVYVGNASGHPGENTYCPKCRRPLVRRAGYAILENLLTPNNGRCPYDGTRIPGVWADEPLKPPPKAAEGKR